MVKLIEVHLYGGRSVSKLLIVFSMIVYLCKYQGYIHSLANKSVLIKPHEYNLATFTRFLRQRERLLFRVDDYNYRTDDIKYSERTVERSIGGRTQSIIGRGYKELELSQVNSCDTG